MTQPIASLLVASRTTRSRTKRSLSDDLRARLLRIILNFTITATVVYAILLQLSDSIPDRFSLFYILTPIPICALLLILTKHRYVRSSALIFVVFVWLIMFFGAWLAGGIQSPAYSGFILPILMAGWLLGRRAGLIVAFLSAVAGILLVALDANGWLVSRVENADFSIWISQILFFFIAATVLYIAAQNNEKLFERLSHNEQLALEANAQLQAEIDARKVAEKELRFQADVLAEVQDAIIVTDAERNILYWNRGAEQIYGLSSEQTLQQPISSVFDLEKGSTTSDDERTESLLATGSWQGEDKSFVRATGEALDVETRIKLVMDESGLPSHVIVSARDIRERVDARDALRYRTDMQQLVTQLATRFIDLPTKEMDQGITEALKMLCEFFQVERGVIGLFSEDLETVTFQYHYHITDVNRPSLAASILPAKEIPWCVNHLKRFESVLVADVENMPPKASVDQRTFGALGTKSFIGVPLVQHEKLIGLLGCSSISRRAAWPKEMMGQLDVLSQIIVNLFERRTFEEDLRKRDTDLNALATQLYTLLDIDRAIFSAQSLEDVAMPALKRLYELCNCKCTSIFLIDDAEGYGSYFAQYPLNESDAFCEPISLTAISDLDDLRDGLILLNGSLADAPSSEMEQEIAAQTDIEAMGRIPLRTNSQLVGILYLGFGASQGLESIDLELVEGVATSLALAIANTQLYEQVQSHADELEFRITESTAELSRQYHLQAALAQIELAINQPSELQSVLEQIVTVTTQTLPADKGVSIILWDPEAETYTVSATSVRNQEQLKPAQHVRKKGGSTRWILDHGETLVVTDAKDDPLGPNSMILEHKIGAYVGVPLLVEGHTIGVLYALMAQPQSFSVDELDFLDTVARRAALAITKVRLFAQAKEIAVEEERQRLARELHDVVSQSLFSANLIAESLPLLMERNPEMVRSGLQDLHLLTRGATNEMRTLLFELRPVELTNTELGDLINQLANAFTGRTRIPVEMTIDSGLHFQPALQICIYRIAQEVLNNVTKHARAKQVWLHASLQANEFKLSIRDDGRGFEQEKVAGGHMGLGIIRERAAEIDAVLAINSAIGEGTTVTLHRHIEDQEIL